MICGGGNFSYVDGDLSQSQPASPSRCSSRKADRNPYSARGLDKFSAVLAELEAKRERIMKQAESRGISSVRFMYTNSTWVPILVKQLPEEEKKHSKKIKRPPSRQTSELIVKTPVVEVQIEDVVVPVQAKKSTGMQEACLGQPKGDRWWRWPAYYWLLVLGIILACLALSGKTFAICCTSIWWYLAPTARDSGGRMTVKKQYKRSTIDGRPRWWRRSF